MLKDELDGAAWGAAGAAGGAAIGEAAGVARAGAKAAKGAKTVPECHSFLPGTGVLLADGTSKAIENLHPGDVVLATDPKTGKTTATPVAASITTEDDKDFTQLTVTTENGPTHLTATDTHPFWIPDLKKWVTAGDLKPGEHLRTSAGTSIPITAVHHYTKHQRTHDLTITGTHTYYVLAGSTPVLVHNCGNAATHDVGNVVDNLDDDVYFHYTSEEGNRGILAADGSLRIGANPAGKVHVTQEIGSSVEIERNVMIKNVHTLGRLIFSSPSVCLKVLSLAQDLS